MREHETRNQIDEKILHSFLYGSYVYGCNTEKSDVDYIVIVESDNDDLYYSVKLSVGDATVYSEQRFIQRIKEHHISALECIFQHNNPYRKYFEYNSDSLRREISSVSSNSFVKCKKKLAKGEDYIGKKSVFHSLRILMFGIQIAKYGSIVDYTEANYLLKDIMEQNSWKDIKRLYQPLFNRLKSEFKILAPLEGEISDGR